MLIIIITNFGKKSEREIDESMSFPFYLPSVYSLLCPLATLNGSWVHSPSVTYLFLVLQPKCFFRRFEILSIHPVHNSCQVFLSICKSYRENLTRRDPFERNKASIHTSSIISYSASVIAPPDFYPDERILFLHFSADCLVFPVT